MSFDRFWTGLALTVCLLQIWHFFWPIDWRTVVLVGGIGIFGQIFTWRENLEKVKGGQHFWLLAAGILFCAWAANLALRMPWNYDSGLYHFQSVRWANEYAIVPGLGNLHPRLAFNQSYFLFVALLNVAPYFQKAHVVANSLLLVALGWQLLVVSFRSTSATRVFSILMFAFVAKQPRVRAFRVLRRTFPFTSWARC